MPRQSRTQKDVQQAVRNEPRRPRKKRERKSLPAGLRKGLPVKITSQEFKGYKLGLISHPCKYDEGIQVLLTNPHKEGVAEYVCIQTERGDTIVSIEKHD